MEIGQDEVCPYEDFPRRHFVSVPRRTSSVEREISLSLSPSSSRPPSIDLNCDQVPPLVAFDGDVDELDHLRPARLQWKKINGTRDNECEETGRRQLSSADLSFRDGSTRSQRGPRISLRHVRLINRSIDIWFGWNEEEQGNHCIDRDQTFDSPPFALTLFPDLPFESDELLVMGMSVSSTLSLEVGAKERTSAGNSAWLDRPCPGRM